MILEPNCSKRKCKHLTGVKQDNKAEETERCVCKAFTNGIPRDIAYGSNKHLKRHPDQDNDIIYEEEE